MQRRAAAVVNYENAVKPFLETKRLSDSDREACRLAGADPGRAALLAHAALYAPESSRTNWISSAFNKACTGTTTAPSASAP